MNEVYGIYIHKSSIIKSSIKLFRASFYKKKRKKERDYNISIKEKTI